MTASAAENCSVPCVVLLSRDANSSRLSVQEVAVAGAHTHGRVWVNISRSQGNSELPRWLGALSGSPAVQVGIRPGEASVVSLIS